MGIITDAKIASELSIKRSRVMARFQPESPTNGLILFLISFLDV
jgi:hypothetical protein